MRTITRLRLQHELDEFFAALMCKSQNRDPFAPHDEELHVRALLYDRWQSSADRALAGVRAADRGRMLGVETLMGFFSHVFGHDTIARGLKADMLQHVAGAFNKGRASVNAAFLKQTGKEPSRENIQKDFVGGNALFGAVFGLTEDHAIQAMLDQATIAAGGFWEDQLSQSIKDELQKLFEGATTREELVSNIEKLVTERMAVGEKTLAKSYFDNLATHQIVRARNVGSYYRAKSLGASHYVLINPKDHRTSPVCKTVADGTTRYEMAGAEETVSGILGAANVSDLKAVAPFYKAGDTVTNPVPPLHWPKCRTWMNFVFE